MDITIATPALLFPTISLLLLAFTNRFLAIAARIRQLHDIYEEKGDDSLRKQIDGLRLRLELIRKMQIYGVSSMFLAVVCMFALAAGWFFVGKVLFGVSLVVLMFALYESLQEIRVSGNALNILLEDMDNTK